MTMNIVTGSNPEATFSADRVLPLPAAAGSEPKYIGVSAIPLQGAAQQTVKISVFDSFEPLQETWTRLDQEGHGFAFQTYDWLKSWYEIIGSRSNLALCLTLVEIPEGVPIMLLPLAIERRGFASCLTWLGGRVSDYRGPLLARDCSLAVDEQRFPGIWKQIRRHLPRHDIVALEGQPEMIGPQRNPFCYLPRTPHVTNAYSTFLGPVLDDFLRQKRSTHWLRDERRKERRLMEQGSLVFHVAETVEDVQRILPEMMRQKSESYRELAVRDLFAEPGCREFFSHISERRVRDGFVHLSAVSLNGKIMATHWGLLYGERFYCLLPTYARDETTRSSPGNVLLRRLFDWCIKRGVRIFDFTIGDEDYKQHWCDQELRMFDCVRATSLRGWLYITPVRIARAAKRAILRSPLRGYAKVLRVSIMKRLRRD